MRCFKLHPEHRDDARRSRGPATLATIRESLALTLDRHFDSVIESLGHELVYGYALFTDPFYELITSCVFTEEGLARTAAHYRRESPSVYGADCPLDKIARGLRWNEADSPYFAFRETEDFHALHLRLGDLWREIDRDDRRGVSDTSTALEGICICALRQFRLSARVAPSMALLLLQGDQGVEERCALAEHFNPPEVLERLHHEWEPDETLVEQYRSRFRRH